ncbi:MAG: 50S ribosomal protein L6 [Thermoplasmatales archaeon]
MRSSTETPIRVIPLDIPEGVSVALHNYSLEIKGKKGQVLKNFKYEYAKLDIKDSKINIYLLRDKRPDLAIVGTWRSIIESALIGVTKGFVYTMKIVYAHFPVKVTVKGNQVMLDNFLGEKSARVISVPSDVKVSVKGDIVTIEGCNLEILGNAAAKIERMSKIKGFDPRVFQDGIYIVKKGDIIEG